MLAFTFLLAVLVLLIRTDSDTPDINPPDDEHTARIGVRSPI